MSDDNVAVQDGEPPAGDQEIAAAELTPDQQVGLEFLRGLFDAAGAGAAPVVRAVQPPYMHVEIAGGDAETTWGRFGQSLDALQFLANLIISRRVSSDVRIMLDAGGYRERRAASLRQRAHVLAEEVKARSEEAELEPLPAHERRIIHAALVDDPEVRTYSEGDEPYRRVVISPRTSS